MATIQKRGNGYKITVSVGYDVKGRQVRHHHTWTPDPKMTPKQTEKELNRQAVLFEEKCKSGNVSDGNIKFQLFAEQWFQEYAEPQLKHRTSQSYHSYEKRVYTAIGHLKMNKISTRHIQKLIIGLGDNGINNRTGKGLSPKSIRNYMSFVSSVFDYAVSQGVVKKNPCRGVKLPSLKQIERDCYSIEETQLFLDLLENESLEWRVFFHLAIFSGLRRGELYGLEWKDIDFGYGIISIKRTSLYTKEKGIYTDTPKTKGSIRSLKLPGHIFNLLIQLKSEHEQRKCDLGDKWKETDRLFIGWDGQPRHPNSAVNWLQRFCKRTGMRIVNIHSFRHLNASLLINNGTDVKTVSAALGHNQVSTTLNIYAHTFAVSQAKAAEAIAANLQINSHNNEIIDIASYKDKSG